MALVLQTLPSSSPADCGEPPSVAVRQSITSRTSSLHSSNQQHHNRSLNETNGSADNNNSSNDNNSVSGDVNVNGDGGGGSSLVGAIFNFTNCIVGAGAIGLGGALAQSGGLISVVSIVSFAILTKRSLDLVISLSIETPGAHGSYEDLGQVAFGVVGRWIITASKFLYSFGCLVAYVVVIKDNLGPALLNLLQQQQHNHHNNSHGGLCHANESWRITCDVLENRIATTWIVCIFVMLPLCLLRDMRPLASFSAISIASILAIVIIIVYLYVDNPGDAIRHNETASSYETWWQIRPGYVECLGTFVFTFVSQHTVHLAFQSLKPELRTARHWNQVSFYSVGIAALLSLTIGVGVYISFGMQAKSDIFDIYPAIPLIDVAKLLLSVTMVLTFPLPFFTCRELLIVNLFPARIHEGNNSENEDDDAVVAEDDSSHISLTRHAEEQNAVGELSDLEQPLLQQQEEEDHESGANAAAAAGMSTSDLDLASVMDVAAAALNYVLLESDPKQLKLPFHVAMTVKLWLVVVGLAIAAPSLGDVLDLVGCATGTMIAFVVPSCISFRLRGFTHEAALLLLVGGVVGTVGTYFSLQQILQDLGLLRWK